MINTATAEDLAICEAAFQQVLDQTRFSTAEDKIKYLRTHEKTCSGTGLFESRLAYFYTMASNFDAAKEVLTQGLAQPNDYHRELKYSLIDLSVATGDVTNAFSESLKLKNEYPDWHGSYLLLAKISLMQSNFEESIKYAIQSNKRSPEAGVYVGMAIAYHSLEKDEEAVDAMLQAIKLDPRVVAHSAGMNETIYSLVKLKKLQDAEMFSDVRIKNDSNWNKDAVFLKAVKFLKSHGLLQDLSI